MIAMELPENDGTPAVDFSHNRPPTIPPPLYATIPPITTQLQRKGAKDYG